MTPSYYPKVLNNSSSRRNIAQNAPNENVIAKFQRNSTGNVFIRGRAKTQRKPICANRQISTFSAFFCKLPLDIYSPTCNSLCSKVSYLTASACLLDHKATRGPSRVASSRIGIFRQTLTVVLDTGVVGRFCDPAFRRVRHATPFGELARIHLKNPFT